MKIENINIEIELTPEQIDVLEPLLAFHEIAAEKDEDGRILGQILMPNIVSFYYVPRQLDDLAMALKEKMLAEIRAEREVANAKTV
jgi:3-polyprenyl-4-hydroxybenzoate decarboxylase